MSLTPRANELDAVEAILTSEDYETERDMAKAIVRALGAELRKRDWYVMPWKFRGEDSGVNYGPFATLTELRREAGRMPEGEHGAVLLLGPDRPRTADSALVSGACVCGHQPEQHVVKVQRGNKISKPAECGVYRTRGSRCDCSDYTPKGKS